MAESAARNLTILTTADIGQIAEVYRILRQWSDEADAVVDVSNQKLVPMNHAKQLKGWRRKNGLEERKSQGSRDP